MANTNNINSIEDAKLKISELTLENQRIKNRLEKYESLEDKQQVEQIFDNDMIKMEYTGFKNNLEKMIISNILELEDKFQDLIRDTNMITVDTVEIVDKNLIEAPFNQPNSSITGDISEISGSRVNSGNNLKENFVRDKVPEVIRENFPRNDIPLRSMGFKNNETATSVNNLKTQNEKNNFELEGVILNQNSKYSLGNQSYGSPLSRFDLQTNNPNFYPLNR